MTEDWKRERLRQTIQQEKSDYQPHDELYLARAAIARVRALLDAADGFTPPLVLTTAELRRALDGA